MESLVISTFLLSFLLIMNSLKFYLKTSLTTCPILWVHYIELHLDGNPLTGSIPKELGNLNKLELLNLNGNSLTGNIPAELGNLNNLQMLNLSGNYLTGCMPPTLGNLSNLKSLDLCYNQLTGSISKGLGNLKKLELLYLYENSLTGSIPPELGNLSNLKTLYLCSNQLSGSIPNEMGNLSYLTNLSLRSNDLTGSIPPEIGNLLKLEVFYLNNNILSGEIPKLLRNLSNLKEPYVDIGYNCLYSNDIGLKTWLNSIDPDWEQNQNECTPKIFASRTSLNIGYIIGSSKMPKETITIYNSGGGTLNWCVSTKADTVTLNPTSGTNYGIVEVTINPVGLQPAKYEGVIYVTDPLAPNSPVEVKIKLWVKTKLESTPPFGDFSTPLDDSIVYNGPIKLDR